MKQVSIYWMLGRLDYYPRNKPFDYPCFPPALDASVGRKTQARHGLHELRRQRLEFSV